MVEHTKKQKINDQKNLQFDLYTEMILCYNTKIAKMTDTTNQVKSCGKTTDNLKYKIIFITGADYTYSKDKVIIMRNPVVLDVNKVTIVHNGKILCDISCLLEFNYNRGSVIRVIYNDGWFESIDSKELQIIENGMATNLLNYFKEIAKKGVVRLSEKEGLYSKEKELSAKKNLLKELEKINSIHKESVLYSYLMQEPVKVREMDFSNIIYPFNFNLSQKEAVEQALTHSISIIQGPPGTGKTQTILNIIANLTAIQQKSIAVVSSNNNAVKNVEEKLQKEGYGFLTAFVGSKDNNDIFFGRKQEKPQLNAWNCGQDIKELYANCNRIGVCLNKLLEVYRDKKNKERELRNWQTEQRHYMEFYFNKEEKMKIPPYFSSTDRIITFLAENAAVQKSGRLYKFLYRLKWHFKYKVKRVPEQKLLLALQKTFYVLKIKELTNKISEMEYILAANAFDNLLKEYQRMSEVLFRKYLYLNYSKLEILEFDSENYQTMFDDFIKRYPIILSSTQSIRKTIQRQRDFLFDYVIIDEASQVDLLTGVLAFSCCRNVIIVGDQQQLPCIVDGKLEKMISAKPFRPEYNYFKENILSSVNLLYRTEVPCTTLREHYRCHPQIIEFCNQRYYNGQLIACTNEGNIRNPFKLWKSSEGTHMRLIEQGRECGIYNQRELDIIDKEVLMQLDIKDWKKVGIVTPFRLQADKAEKQLNLNIESDTIHKYQGREKEIMIFTTVLDSKKSSEKMIEFVDDPRMINVAVSRAQNQFFLVVDYKTLKNRTKEIDALIRYIQYNTPQENIIESQVISVFDLLYTEFSKKLLPLKNKLMPKAEHMSEEIIRVLLKEIFTEKEYDSYWYTQEVEMYNLIYMDEYKHDDSRTPLTEREKYFVKKGSAVDFLIYHKMDKHCVMVIEVDGVTNHENNKIQLERDRVKDSILKKYGIPVLRLKTNGSDEENRIKNKLDDIKRKEILENIN